MIRKLLCGMIRCYQMLIAIHMPPSCRFMPSCSRYALEAIETHGATRGVWLATKRIGRCHPWGSCGFDPVPEVEER